MVIHSDDKIVYLNPPRIDGPEHRTHAMQDVRVLADAVLEMQRQALRMQTTLRTLWPEDYPVPPEVDLACRHAAAACDLADRAMARARSGLLRTLGEHANG